MLWTNVHADRANIVVAIAMNIHADESFGPVLAISRAGDGPGVPESLRHPLPPRPFGLAPAILLWLVPAH